MRTFNILLSGKYTDFKLADHYKALNLPDHKDGDIINVKSKNSDNVYFYIDKSDAYLDLTGLPKLDITIILNTDNFKLEPLDYRTYKERYKK